MTQPFDSNLPAPLADLDRQYDMLVTQVEQGLISNEQAFQQLATFTATDGAGCVWSVSPDGEFVRSVAGQPPQPCPAHEFVSAPTAPVSPPHAAPEPAANPSLGSTGFPASAPAFESSAPPPTMSPPAGMSEPQGMAAPTNPTAAAPGQPPAPWGNPYDRAPSPAGSPWGSPALTEPPAATTPPWASSAPAASQQAPAEAEKLDRFAGVKAWVKKNKVFAIVVVVGLALVGFAILRPDGSVAPQPAPAPTASPTAAPEPDPAPAPNPEPTRTADPEPGPSGGPTETDEENTAQAYASGDLIRAASVTVNANDEAALWQAIIVTTGTARTGNKISLSDVVKVKDSDRWRQTWTIRNESGVDIFKARVAWVSDGNRWRLLNPPNYQPVS